MHDPFIEMVKDVAETGAQTAREMYGARGWVLHPQYRPLAHDRRCRQRPRRHMADMQCMVLLSPMGEVSFSGDKTYLAEVYPVMKGCAEFFRDFLVEDQTRDIW